MFRNKIAITKKMILAAVLFLFGIATVAFLVYMVMVSRHEFLLWQECQMLFANGDYEAAQTKLQQLVKANPSHEDGFRLLSKTDEELCDYSDACNHWWRVHELNMFDMESRKRLAECLMMDHQYLRAMRYYRAGFALPSQSLGPEGGNQSLLSLLPNQVKSESGDSSEVAKTSEMPKDLDASEKLVYAEAVLMAGNKDLIPVTMERVRESVDNEKMLDFLEGLLKIRMGEFEKGHEIFKTLLSHDDLSKTLRWRMEAILGGVVSACGDVEHAERHFLKAYSLFPKISNRLLGEFYRAHGRFEKSIPYWQGEMKCHPKDDYTRMQLIETFGGLGDQASLVELRKTLTLSSRSQRELGHYADAAVCLLEHDYEKVLENLKKCLCYYERNFYHVMRLCSTLELGGDLHLEEDLGVLRRGYLSDPFVKLVIGRLHGRLLAALQGNDMEKALQYAGWMWSFTRMQLPEMRMAAKLLMADMFEKRDFSNALELGKFCLKYDEQDKEVLRVLVMSSLATSKFVECMDYSESLGDKDPTALAARANAFAYVGQTHKVIETYRAFLKLKPHDPLMLETAWRLFEELGVEDGMTYVESLYEMGDLMNELRRDCLHALHQLWGKDRSGFEKSANRILKNLQKMPDSVSSNPEMIYWSAVLKARLGQRMEAIEELKTAVQMGYANAFVFCEISEAYSKTGEEHLGEALEIARSTARLWPGWYVADCCLRRRNQEYQAMIKKKTPEVKNEGE